MRRIIVKILVFIARKIDFTTLQVSTLNYFDKHDPIHAKKVYELRACELKIKEQMKNRQIDDEWD